MNFRLNIRPWLNNKILKTIHTVSTCTCLIEEKQLLSILLSTLFIIFQSFRVVIDGLNIRFNIEH